MPKFTLAYKASNGTVVPQPTPQPTYPADDNGIIPLTFVAGEDNSTIKVQKMPDPNAAIWTGCYYRTSNIQDWTAYTFTNGIGLELTLNQNEYVQFKSSYPNEASDIYGSFVMTGSFAAAGHLFSLNDYRTPTESYTALYYRLFYNCTSLTSMPIIQEESQIIVGYETYAELFAGCNNITGKPELFATSIADYGYSGLFKDCSKLDYIKVHFTSWTGASWGSPISVDWVDGVSATGTFVCPKELPIEFGPDRIPEGWTVETF